MKRHFSYFLYASILQYTALENKVANKIYKFRTKTKNKSNFSIYTFSLSSQTFFQQAEMEALKFNRSNNNSSRWKRRSLSSHRSPLLLLLLLTFLLLLLFFLSYNHFSPSLLPISTNSQFPHCSTSLTLGDKFLWYAPHSGFSNQLFEFKNALLLAAILNRTLIVPPILDHHAVVLGSCPKFRVSSPIELRFSVWNHVMDLIRSRR